MPGQFSDEHGGEDGDNGDDDCDKVDNSVFGHPGGVNDIRYACGYTNLERLSVVPEV